MPKPRPTVYSYSRLSTFDKCRFQYAMRYCERVYPWWQSIEAFLGTCCHSVIEAVERRQCPRRIAPAWELLEKQWKEKWHDGLFDPRGYGFGYWKDYAAKCLRGYIDIGEPYEGFEVVGLEKKFGAPLLDEPMASFVGIIDRLLRRGNEFIVQDFKTGKVAPKRYYEADHQLPIYARLVANDFLLPLDAEIRVERLYLGFQKIAPIVTTRERRDEAWWWAQETAREAAHFEQEYARTKEAEPHQSKLCDWCVYRPQCPVWASATSEVM